MLFYGTTSPNACFNVGLAQGPCIFVGFSSLTPTKTGLTR